MSTSTLAWVVLTMGDRWPDTLLAIESLARTSPGDPIVLVLNGADPSAVPELPDRVQVVALPENIGVPGGRATGVQALDPSYDYIGFLDDDALALGEGLGQALRARFDTDESIAVVTLRLVDPDGGTARRHSPRVGRRGVAEPGPVPTFLGGASVIRRSAYDHVGGYWSELFYSHEELELSWRLIDAGYTVFYDPDLLVEHPKTDIARHPQGWELTGRNRVLIARRDLPWPIMVTHTLVWLVAGVGRAPSGDCRRAYVRGWWSGWRRPVDRRPMAWVTVRRLAALGRPPVI